MRNSRVAVLWVSLILIFALSACGSTKNPVTTNTPSSNASTSKAPTKSEVFVSECGYGYSQKPSSITLACADGGMSVVDLKFTSWGADSAKGTGIYAQNNCDPNCAEGKFIKIPVTVSLSNPMKDTKGTLIFSTLFITAKTTLYNGAKNATFDIAYQPENSDTSAVTPEPQTPTFTPEEAANDLIARLNANDELWQFNELATSAAGQMAHKRLGLYSEPDYVIECNLRMSGTWLFIYSDENAAYDAFNSDYFFRTSGYSAKFMHDPKTNLFVMLHTSLGGNRTCINSVLEQLEPYATD